MIAKLPWSNLGKGISHKKDFITINDLKNYKRCRVQIKSRGIILRDIKQGSEIKTKKQQICNEGQLLVAEIDAKVGGYGIVPKELEGAIVSGHYFLYDINKNIIDPNFLAFFMKTSNFHNQIIAQGSTNYAAIRPQNVLNYKIPLPDTKIQKKIADRINQLKIRIDHVKKLRNQVFEESNYILDSVLNEVTNKNKKNPKWEFGPMPKFVEINPSRKGKTKHNSETPVSFVPMSSVDAEYGIIKTPIIKPYYQVAKGYKWFLDGDVIFARITPSMENGKSAIARNLSNGVGFGSTEFHVLRPSAKILAEWIHVIVRNKKFRFEAAKKFKGTAGQQRVPDSFLEQKEIAVPDIKEQRKILNFLDNLGKKMKELNHRQSKIEKELNLLFPSILNQTFNITSVN